MATQIKKKKGRPSKYKPQFCQEIIDFFSGEPYQLTVTEEMKEYFTNGILKKELARKKLIPEKLPTFFRFSEKIKVDQGTLLEWAAKYPAFSRAFTRAKELQKEFLMALGLAGVTPPAAFMFIASNITDMRSHGVMPDDLPPGSMIVPVIIRRGDERPKLITAPPGPETIDVKVLQHE